MKKEIRQLIAKGRRSLGAAKTLLDQGDADFSVSRSYYAMFYVTEALLLSRNLVSSKHSGILSLLFEHFVKPGLIQKSLHQDFHRLFDLRQEGDYWSESTITIEVAKESLETARQFIAAIERLISEQ